MPSSITSSTTDPASSGGVGSSALSTSAPGLVSGGAGAVDGGRPRVPEARRAAGRESGSGRLDNGHGAGPTTAAEGGGLVICAKNVRTPDDRDLGSQRQWRAVDALGMRFPSPEMVQSAAALFDKAQPWASDRGRLGTKPESGRFRITVGPGVIRLGWTNPVQKPASEPDKDTNSTRPTGSTALITCLARLPGLILVPS